VVGLASDCPFTLRFNMDPNNTGISLFYFILKSVSHQMKTSCDKYQSPDYLLTSQVPSLSKQNCRLWVDTIIGKMSPSTSASSSTTSGGGGAAGEVAPSTIGIMLFKSLFGHVRILPTWKLFKRLQRGNGSAGLGTPSRKIIWTNMGY
jgi:hypothetical protein